MNRPRAVGLALAVALGLIALSLSAPGRDLERRLSSPVASVPTSERSRLFTLLRRAGFLFPEPTESAHDSSADGSQPCVEPELGTEPVDANAMPSSRDVPPDLVARGVPVVSLQLDPCRLARLRAHPEIGGERVEEQGWVSFFDGGELRFASGVGIRLHGGADRPGANEVPSQWIRGYRLHFRSRYGAEGFPGALLAPDLGAPVGHVIVRDDALTDRGGVTWFFISALASEIAQRVGVEAPRARPVWLVLNGESRGIPALIEHVSPELLKRRYGHDDFDFVAAKGRRDPKEQRLLDREMRWLGAQPSPLRQGRVRHRYDVAALTRWLIADLFCATGDSFQAFLVRDQTGRLARGRWFPILWDMDASFLTVSGTASWRLLQDPLRHLTGRQAPLDVPLFLVLHRLLREDPAYRGRIARETLAALDGPLAADRLAEMHARYSALAGTMGLHDRRFLDELARFFVERPRILREQMKVLLAAPAVIEGDLFPDPPSPRAVHPRRVRRRRPQRGPG